MSAGLASPAGASGPPDHAAVAPSEDYTVFTPERVGLRYDVAGLGSRAAAALLDTAIQAVLWIALLVSFSVSVDRLPSVDDAPPAIVVALIIVVVLGGFFLLWGYYMVFEIAWSGQTPGKRVLGIRVIRENGYPIRAVDSVVRNLIRVIDAPPFGFIIGALVMLLNARSKRLGDFAAGTLVVREGKRQRLDQLSTFATALPLTPVSARTQAESPAPGEAPAPGPTAVLSAEDATLLRDFLVRRSSMDSEPRAALAHRLATHLTQRYGLPAPARSREEPFLEALAST